jgi:type VI secretion system protein ImpH
MECNFQGLSRSYPQELGSKEHLRDELVRRFPSLSTSLGTVGSDIEHAPHTQAMSPTVLEHVLSAYFDVPTKVEECISKRLQLAEHKQACLNMHCTLDRNFVLGTREKTKRVRLRIGPMSIGQYECFLPRTEGAHTLAKMVALFRLSELRVEVQLVLRAKDLLPMTLSTRTRPGFRLGYASVPMPRPGARDFDDFRYLLPRV